MNKKLEALKNITGEFFDVDEENKIVKMELDYAKPSEIFDNTAKTKIPMLSDDFIDWMKTSFEYTPRGYKIDLNISFDEMEKYTPEDLEEILKKNIALETVRVLRQSRSKNLIAIGLVAIGVISFIAMMLINALWVDQSIVKDIFVYIADIAVTVTFWEAMTILIVENKETTDYYRNLIRGFSKITFNKKEK